MKWFIIYTKPQCEIKVANSLESMGIKSYCPVVKQIKQYSDRKKKVEIPLLRSYVMVKIEDKDRNRVFGKSQLNTKFVFFLYIVSLNNV